MGKIQDAANGHWPDILSCLAGLSADQLTDKHQPCPLCGGKDRYRFDDNNGNGTWFCNQCGGKNHSGGGSNGMDMLMRRTKWDFKTAVQKIEQHLGIAREIPKPPLDGAEYVFKYTEDFYVLRFPNKKIRPFVFDGSRWKAGAPPEPKPLYNLNELFAKPAANVLVVEGEKAADAAKRLYPDFAVTTWSSGCNAFRKSNWQPVEGRTVFLWPDADEPGHEAMVKLSAHLLKNGVSDIYIVTPPPNAPKGWDLADAIWSEDEATTYILANITQVTPLPEPEPEPEVEQPDITPPDSIPEDNEYFCCLGFNDNQYYYQPHQTGQVVSLSRSAHGSGANLCALAPLAYWETLYPSKTGVNWTAAASSLFAKNHAVGFYDPTLLRGRGFWWDDDRSLLHLGDRIIVDGDTIPSTTKLSNSRYNYQRLVSLKGPKINSPLGDNEARQIATIANSLLWESKVSAKLLVGWVVLAPICGVLNWRPHAWLTAGAGSGKSTVLEDFVIPLLGDMRLVVVGNTSEAGIRQSLKADALPVIFDEAESNERADQIRMQSILSLARVASFETDANILKGSSDGTMQNFKIRSMFMFSSIATALKQGADRSRFAQLTLKNPEVEFATAEERAAHWDAIRKALDTYISVDVGRRLQARTFSLIPVIRDSIEVYKKAASEFFGGNQRDGDQYGTLMAGAWCLAFDRPPTREEAYASMGSAADWEAHLSRKDTSDHRTCVDIIMQHQIKIEGEDKTVTRTIAELILISLEWELDKNLVHKNVNAVLGRVGIKVDKSKNIFFGVNSHGLKRILKDTAWQDCYADILGRLAGATTGHSKYFAGYGRTSRCVSIPVSTLGLQKEAF